MKKAGRVETGRAETGRAETGRAETGRIDPTVVVKYCVRKSLLSPFFPACDVGPLSLVVSLRKWPFSHWIKRFYK